jgi:hypothetical protein
LGKLHIRYHRAIESKTLAPKELVDFDIHRSQCASQSWDSEIGIAAAAHKEVECGIPVLRPSMNADVRLGQDSNARHATRFGKVVQMDVQEGRVCDADGFDESALYALNVVEISGLEKINNQVGPSELLTITRNKGALRTGRSKCSNMIPEINRPIFNAHRPHSPVNCQTALITIARNSTARYQILN